jgi:hypothetical protein
MATNKSMIELLLRQTELVEELNAINKVIKEHIKAQKRQGGADYGDEYVYNEATKEYKRIW